MNENRTGLVILLVALFILTVSALTFGSDNRSELTISFEEKLTFSRSEEFSIDSETSLNAV